LLGTDQGNEEERMRLRGILRRTVEEIQVLIVRRGVDRLLAVQVWFAGGNRCRHFLIYYRPARGTVTKKMPARWWPLDFKSTGLTNLPDLRKRDHARRVEAALEKLDLADVG
jgi:hypothetical protein